MWLSTIVVRYRLLANVLYTMSYVADWRSNVSSKTQRHDGRDPVEDRGVQLWPGLGNRGALMACVFNDARDWTHSVLVHVHVLRVRRLVGCIGVLLHLLLVPTILLGPGCAFAG